MPSRHHLLVLPVGLATTPLLLSALGLGGAAHWSPGFVQTLACFGIVLALIAVAFALVDGFNNRTEAVRPSAIIAPQLAGFLVLDVFEHGLTPTMSMRVPCSRTFLIAASAHAAVAFTAWLALRLSRCVGQKLARDASRAAASATPQARVRSSVSAITPIAVAVGSLSRRGPPRSNWLAFA